MTYPPVQTEEETLRYFGVACISGIVTFATVYILEAFFRPAWLSKLAKSKQTLFYTTVTSDVHAVIVSVMAIYALTYGEEMYKDFVWGKYELASVACAITIGYMTADMIITLLRWSEIGDMAFLLHHLTSIFAFIYVCMVGSYRFFAMIRLLAELSTVFVNARSTLYDLGLQSSSAYFYNGLIMVGAFTIARIIPFPFYLYAIISVTGTDGYNASGLGRYIVWGSTFSLDLLNFLWYRKMIKGAVKVWNIHADKSEPVSTSSRGKTVKQG